jgi:hypothetical protein
MDDGFAELQRRHRKFSKRIAKFESGDEEPSSKEIKYLGKEENRIMALNTVIGQGQRMLSYTALGAWYEFYPLLDRCFRIVRHEKEFRGGSPDGDEYDHLFEVCPFRNITQRRATNEESDAKAAAEGLLQPGTATRTPKGAPQLEDKERPSTTLLGVWAGLIHNVSNLSYVGYPSKRGLHQSQRGSTVVAHSMLPGNLAPTSTTARRWIPLHNNISVFRDGEACWQGPPRQVRLVFRCHQIDEFLSMFEDGKCIYEAEFGTPSACTDAALAEITQHYLAFTKAQPPPPPPATPPAS